MNKEQLIARSSELEIDLDLNNGELKNSQLQLMVTGAEAPDAISDLETAHATAIGEKDTAHATAIGEKDTKITEMEGVIEELTGEVERLAANQDTSKTIVTDGKKKYQLTAAKVRIPGVDGGIYTAEQLVEDSTLVKKLVAMKAGVLVPVE